MFGLSPLKNKAPTEGNPMSALISTVEGLPIPKSPFGISMLGLSIPTNPERKAVKPCPGRWHMTT
jgi:hypothetical protein